MKRGLLRFLSAAALLASPFMGYWSVSYLMGQDSVKPVISDKDRANYLVTQRDWIGLRQQYESAFAKEPIAVEYESKTVGLQKMCQAGGAQFDPKLVQCEMPKTEAKKQ